MLTCIIKKPRRQAKLAGDREVFFNSKGGGGGGSLQLGENAPWVPALAVIHLYVCISICGNGGGEVGCRACLQLRECPLMPPMPPPLMPSLVASSRPITCSKSDFRMWKFSQKRVFPHIYDSWKSLHPA